MVANQLVSTQTSKNQSFCSTLVPTIDWTTYDELYYSDHFPICITYNSDGHKLEQNKSPRWKFELANWNEYKLKLHNWITSPEEPLGLNTSKIDELLDEYLRSMCNEANHAIPKANLDAIHRSALAPWNVSRKNRAIF